MLVALLSPRPQIAPLLPNEGVSEPSCFGLTTFLGVAAASRADVSERRRRWSGSNKAVSIDETDEGTEQEDESFVEDPKLKVSISVLNWCVQSLGFVDN